MGDPCERLTWARAGFKLDLVNAVVLPDGKVSLPAELREALGLTPGTVLEIQNQSGKIAARASSIYNHRSAFI